MALCMTADTNLSLNSTFIPRKSHQSDKKPKCFGFPGIKSRYTKCSYRTLAHSLTRSIKTGRTDPVRWSKSCQGVFPFPNCQRQMTWLKMTLGCWNPSVFTAQEELGAKSRVLIKYSTENLDDQGEIFHIFNARHRDDADLSLDFVVSNLLFRRGNPVVSHFTFRPQREASLLVRFWSRRMIDDWR